MNDFLFYHLLATELILVDAALELKCAHVEVAFHLLSQPSF